MSRNAKVFALFCYLRRSGVALFAGALVSVSSASGGPSVKLPPSPTNRVVIVENQNATDAFQPRLDIVRQMVDQGVTKLLTTTNVAAAWQQLASPQDVIGLKVYCAPGRNCGTRPALVAAVIESLSAAGFSASNIVVWDKHRSELRRAGFFDLAARYGVGIEGAADVGWDSTNYYEAPLVGHLLYGDLEFGRKDEGAGRKSFLSKLVTRRVTKIIQLTPLLNHNTAGVCGNLYSLAMGSVDNTTRFEAEARHMASAVPEIYALEALGDKVVLNIVDALICQYQGEDQGLLHYSIALNELRLSKDPLALDILSLQELDWQRRAARVRSPTNHFELYQNAALLELGVNDLASIKIERVK
ncbi:MAG TPA: DUF362 domain-containing protein [Verrucomicrobiae bacterium]|nr:DUF362 domain-containing protein [Verrucomicrobiae bacterium]